MSRNPPSTEDAAFMLYCRKCGLFDAEAIMCSASNINCVRSNVHTPGPHPWVGGRNIDKHSISNIESFSDLREAEREDILMKLMGSQLCSYPSKGV